MTKQVADDRPARFVAELNRLERGRLAQLRRGLGGDERSVYWLEGLYTRTGYGEAKSFEKEALQLVAGLYALKPRARHDEGDGAQVEAPEPDASADPEKGSSIGVLMGRLHRRQNLDAGRKPDEGSSTEKRFLALLDADRDGLAYHMRQAVMLLAARDETPDWVRLTTDLLRWGDHVRRRWAQDFYREISREAKDTAAAPSDTTTAPQGAEQ